MSSSAVLPLSDVVRRERERAGLTRLQLADRAGLSRSAIGHVESGRRPDPCASTVKRLANGLGVSIDWLLAALP
jgi:transcriptional regulator with XRE-family HTH domain